MARVCCSGELMWDLVAEDGSIEQATRFERRVGGAAANVARGLVALGVNASVSGTVSSDALGHAYVATLASDGVDVHAIARRRGRMGCVFMDGARFVSYRPSYERWPARLGWPAGWSRGRLSSHVLLIAALSPDNPELAAQRDLARRAKARDALVVVDVNARPRAWRRARTIPKTAAALLAMADVVKVSRDDLEVLAIEDDVHAARAALGVRGTLVLTRGAAPLEALGPWGTLRRRPERVKVVRHIGAGDAFVAGLVAAIANGGAPDTRDAWRDALAAALAAGARWVAGTNVSRMRARPAGGRRVR